MNNLKPFINFLWRNKMEIKIKIKRPGKGSLALSFVCTAEETAQLLKLEKKNQRRIAKKEKKNNDM